MRAILTAAMLFAATSAWADWTKVANDADAAFYVDPASVGDKGSRFRQVAVVQDNAKPDSVGARSLRVSYEIDCTEGRLRSLSATGYSEPMAGGKSVDSWDRESDWLYIAPRTGTNIAPSAVFTAIVKFVCSR